VTPECRYFGACGGCQYQHIDYAAQLRFKHKQISDLFERCWKNFDGQSMRRSSLLFALRLSQPIMIRSQWNGPAKKLEIGFIRRTTNRETSKMQNRRAGG